VQNVKQVEKVATMKDYQIQLEARVADLTKKFEKSSEELKKVQT